MFKAHGAMWTVETAKARIDELEAINNDPNGPGPSDGRVTEIDNLREGIAQWQASEAAYVALSRQAEWGQRLAHIEANPFFANDSEHRVTWIDRDGHRKVSRYTTEKGMLKGMLRIERELRGNVVDAF